MGKWLAKIETPTLEDRAEEAANLWGNGSVTVDQLIYQLHPDEMGHAATASREWWQAWTISFQTPSPPPTGVWAEMAERIRSRQDATRGRGD